MPFKNQKLKGGSVVEQKIQLLVKDTPDATEQYSTEPTCEHLNNLTLRNLKFMSTHNSFIQPCQYGCEVRTKEVEEYLSNLQFFPICLEIDLMACKVDDEIQVFHFGGNSGRQYMSLEEIFNFILGVISEIKTIFFPLLLSIDTTQITTAKKIRILKKCPSGNQTTLHKNDILTQFKNKFSTYLHKKDEDELQNSLESTLPYLMGKVLIRFRHKGTNIGTEENETVQFKGEVKGKSITANEKTNFLRVFPSGGNWRESLRKAIKADKVLTSVSTTNDINEVSLGGINEDNEEEENFGFFNNNDEDNVGRQKILRRESISLNVDEVGEFEGFNQNTGSKRASTNFKEDKDAYKTLSTGMIDSYLFQKNNINCLAFNWQHLTPEMQGKVTFAFQVLYKNLELEDVFDDFNDGEVKRKIINSKVWNINKGGGKKNKTRKKQRRKRTRRRKSNKKRNLKK